MLALNQIKIQQEKKTEDYGKFIIEPLDPGYGNTIGNTLRRVLLSSLPGAAITQVQIEGVRHQFSTLEGLKEDIIEFILNLKKIRLKMSVEKPAKLSLSVKGPREVLAKDINVPAGVEILNSEQVLAHLASPKAKLSCTMVCEHGEGYVPSEERPKGEIGLLPIDALFSPIESVNYQVETTRVERLTNFDRLILEIKTDGTIGPSDALKKAAQILVDRFRLFYEPRQAVVEAQAEEIIERIPQETLDTTLEELDLPVRQVNALKKKKVVTIGDFLKTPKEERLQIKNYGPKSDEQIVEKLKSQGVPVS
ncbi:DNA-directed RNA polymerase subunit alpha [Candidatus Curtissbacteria bacterium RBG_16_39_7]|uniref:DNA-directed RNA polymerase subunit alpha n=1 Tax=Candidatus Curtissbacteria bacterium RBG_16_39_7 TaxID=1797707 RepID=A0A1F5G1R1_9BACT|nr:MAG: DNA-directed RNA polymerase subunit alpha [Candidatus Curtissbacteria bacterium RBG_16_39_7]